LKIIGEFYSVGIAFLKKIATRENEHADYEYDDDIFHFYIFF